jgi:catechol 2,3-dioxygenase-like lactoylglutathione lyase family enzyme
VESRGELESELVTIKAIDHLVLTVNDIRTACDFYGDVLGMKITVFDDNRIAFRFGRQKINVHQAGQEFEPKALRPGPGTADLCFTTDANLGQWKRHLEKCHVKILLGPIRQTGAAGEMESIYIRDPDGNLVEIAQYQRSETRNDFEKSERNRSTKGKRPHFR